MSALPSSFPVLVLESSLYHFSWTAYENTAEINDEQLNTNLRTTLLYATFQTARESESVPTELFLTPTQALERPTTAELVNRFPELTAGQIEDLEADYEVEAERLLALVQNSGLEAWWSRVSMLDAEDRRRV